MYGLIKCIYDEKKQRSIESLYNDSDSHTQLLIRATIAEALKDCPKLLESHGSDWILCTLASYNRPEEDTARAYQSIMRMLHKMEFGILTDDIKWREINEIADGCLVGLGFFRKRMEQMYNHRASPSPDYYRQTGSAAFNRLGFDDLGCNFSGWIRFIESELATISFN